MNPARRVERALSSQTYEDLCWSGNHYARWANCNSCGLRGVLSERLALPRAKASAAFVSSEHEIVNQILMRELPAATGKVDTECRSAVGGKSLRQAPQ